MASASDRLPRLWGETSRISKILPRSSLCLQANRQTIHTNEVFVGLINWNWLIKQGWSRLSTQTLHAFLYHGWIWRRTRGPEWLSPNDDSIYWLGTFRTELCNGCHELLDVLYPDWIMKLVGSLIYGAVNMSVRNAGFLTLLCNESPWKYIFYCIWCLAHQIELVVKHLVERIYDYCVLPFMKPLMKIIAYLFQQKILIKNMGRKFPYYINVHWKSLAEVYKWILRNKK